MKTAVLALFFLLITQRSEATVRVAFFEGQWPNGRVIHLSPGEKFFHVAIKIDGLWYQSTPGKVVAPIKSFKVGAGMVLSEVLETSQLNLTAEDVEPFLGQEFDFTFSWASRVKTYCSKLVANILGIKPTGMTFRGRHWRGSKKLKRLRKNSMGISPDELYKALIQEGFIKVYDRYQPRVLRPAKRSVLFCKELL